MSKLDKMKKLGLLGCLSDSEITSENCESHLHGEKVNPENNCVRPIWFSTKEKNPPISYLESDNFDDPYECYPVLVYSNESPGIYCIAALCKNQNEGDWDFGRLFWQLYIPGSGGDIIDRSFEIFSHWMKIPSQPSD